MTVGEDRYFVRAERIRDDIFLWAGRLGPENSQPKPVRMWVRFWLSLDYNDTLACRGPVSSVLCRLCIKNYRLLHRQIPLLMLEADDEWFRHGPPGERRLAVRLECDS